LQPVQARAKEAAGDGAGVLAGGRRKHRRSRRSETRSSRKRKTRKVLRVCVYPYTLFPLPYTLHPTPYNLYHIPYTLYTEFKEKKNKEGIVCARVLRRP
jgi:hypothetical protein